MLFKGSELIECSQFAMRWCIAVEWYGLMAFSVLEEKFAQAVCFLLVDLYLLTFQPEKALHLLAVLEKLSVQGNIKNGKGEVRTNTTVK